MKTKIQIRKCKFCKKVFEFNFYKLGLDWCKKHNRGIFCKRSCYYAYRKGMRVSPKTEFTSENMKWDKHINFKTGLWSYQQFRKDACEHCKSHKNLMVHHIDHNRNNNLIENLRTVCAGCHTRIEHPRKFGGNKYVRI